MINQQRSKKNIKVSSHTVSNDVEFKNYELDDAIKTNMIKDAFKMFDQDGSRTIDLREFKKLVISLGIELDDKKITNLYKEIDIDGNGVIDLEEFTNMMMKYQFGRDSAIELHLENCFSLYDKNGDGFIDVDDFKKAADELEEIFSVEDIDLLIKIIKVISKEKNIQGSEENINKISKEEFINALCRFEFIHEVKKEDLEERRDKQNHSPSIKDRVNTSSKFSAKDLSSSHFKEISSSGAKSYMRDDEIKRTSSRGELSKSSRSDLV
jgi:calmodulin